MRIPSFSSIVLEFLLQERQRRRRSECNGDRER